VIRDLAILFIHLVVTVARLFGPGGARSIVAESLLVKHQLLIINRSRARAPVLRPVDRIIVGFCAILMRPTRLLRAAIILKPSTILRFHRDLVKRKYRLLFTPKSRGKPGPKGPSPELISAILEMKHRNPNFGHQRIADQISLVFDIEIDKDVVRRVLAKHYRPEPGSNGPSWLSFLGHSKDSLWSVDLFRCESLILRSHWVMVVMDQFSRRIVGFAAHAGALDGPAVCRMFNRIVSGSEAPRYPSSDNDPLFLFHQWQANLRILNVMEVKTVPYVPLSHPFVERLIGTVRREYLDQVPFWSARDLERKLMSFQDYYNMDRVHRGLYGYPPDKTSSILDRNIARLDDYRWEKRCRGLYQLPIAA
jgi:putative transposase